MEFVYDTSSNIYIRIESDDRKKLANKMKTLYGSQEALVSASGMNGIYLVLKSIALCNSRFNSVFLASDELYSETESDILELLQEEYTNLKIVKFKAGDTDDLCNKIKENNKNLMCVFTESASNPSGKMIDWERLAGIIPPYCNLVVDNTWLTPIIFNPFKYGASIVVDSCTKYLSGGSCIGGIMLFSNEGISVNIYRQVYFLLSAMGIHVSPINCKMISDGVDSLEQRIQLTHLNTTNILKKLQENNYVKTILHPLIPYHISHEIYKKYTSAQACGVIWFYVGYDKTKVTMETYYDILSDMCTKLGIRYETSFGKKYNLIERWPEFANDNIGLRISIGYDENPEEFYKKLSTLFKAIN